MKGAGSRKRVNDVSLKELETRLRPVYGFFEKTMPQRTPEMDPQRQRGPGAAVQAPYEARRDIE